MNDMKKIYLIYIVSILLSLPISAQNIMKGTGEVRNLEVKRNGSSVAIDMDIDISELEIGADETLIITPTIEKGNNAYELPSVEIMGKRAYIYHLRNGENTVTDSPFYAERVAKRAEKKAGEKQLIDYTTSINFKEWMRGGTVSIKRAAAVALILLSLWARRTLVVSYRRSTSPATACRMLSQSQSL